MADRKDSKGRADEAERPPVRRSSTMPEPLPALEEAEALEDARSSSKTVRKFSKLKSMPLPELADREDPKRHSIEKGESHHKGSRRAYSKSFPTPEIIVSAPSSRAGSKILCRARTPEIIVSPMPPASSSQEVQKRASLGSPEENDALIAGLAQSLAPQNHARGRGGSQNLRENKAGSGSQSPSSVTADFGIDVPDAGKNFTDPRPLTPNMLDLPRRSSKEKVRRSSGVVGETAGGHRRKSAEILNAAKPQPAMDYMNVKATEDHGGTRRKGGQRSMEVSSASMMLTEENMTGLKTKGASKQDVPYAIYTPVASRRGSQVYDEDRRGSHRGSKEDGGQRRASGELLRYGVSESRRGSAAFRRSGSGGSGGFSSRRGSVEQHVRGSVGSFATPFYEDYDDGVDGLSDCYGDDSRRPSITLNLREQYRASRTSSHELLSEGGSASMGLLQVATSRVGRRASRQESLQEEEASVLRPGSLAPSRAQTPRASFRKASSFDDVTSPHALVRDDEDDDEDFESSFPIWARPVMDNSDSPLTALKNRHREEKKQMKTKMMEDDDDTRFVSENGLSIFPHKSSASAPEKPCTPPIFTHNGAWVRPGSVCDMVRTKIYQKPDKPAEQHVGYIDGQAGLDIGNAILAFEFIDRINDEVFHHYLPIIDETISEDLGLTHDTARLAMQLSREELRHQSVASHVAYTSDDSEGVSRYDTDSNTQSQSTLYGDDGSTPLPVLLYSDDPSRPGSRQSGNINLNASGVSQQDGQEYARDTEERMREERIREEHSPTSIFTDSSLTRESPRPGELGDIALEALGVPRACSVLDSVHSQSREFLVVSLKDAGDRSLCRGEEPTFVEDQLVTVDDLYAGLKSRPSHDESRKSRVPPLTSVHASSAESQVWPHASTFTPKATAEIRSARLKAVDSMPEPVHQICPSLFETSASRQMSAERESTTSSLTLPGVDAITGSSLVSTLRGKNLLTAGTSMMIVHEGAALERPDLRMQPLADTSDPASGGATLKSCYAAGAGRVRVVGHHQSERARLGQIKARAKARAQKHASVCVKRKPVPSVVRPRWSGVFGSGLNGPFSSGLNAAGMERTMTPSAELPDGSGGSVPVIIEVPAGVIASSSAPDSLLPACPGVACEADSDTGDKAPVLFINVVPGSGAVGEAQAGPADEEQQWPPRHGSDQFEEALLTIQCLQGGMASSRAKNKKTKDCLFQENSHCPFSGDDLGETATVDLRCGHRFALARLNTARLGPALCASAGFALEHALICPLCGDQDITTMPRAGDVPTKKMLTCYSTNKDAYLGELQKDWQRPLSLPMQGAADIRQNPKSGDGQVDVTKLPETIIVTMPPEPRRMSVDQRSAPRRKHNLT